MNTYVANRDSTMASFKKKMQVSFFFKSSNATGEDNDSSCMFISNWTYMTC